MIRVSGQSKSRPVKAAGAESCGQTRNQKLHAAVAKSTFWSENVQNTRVRGTFLKFRCRKMARREAHLQVKMYKTPHVRSTFWSSDVWKMARRCSAKHICKWKCTKHRMFGGLFEVPVQTSKNCTPLWREANLQVKMLKNWRSRSTFWSADVDKLHAAVARSTCVSQNVQNTCVLANTFCSLDVEKSVS